MEAGLGDELLVDDEAPLVEEGGPHPALAEGAPGDDVQLLDDVGEQ